MVHLINKGKPALVPKASFQRQAAGLLTYSFGLGRLPEILGFQWHSGQREELTAAGTVRDLHPIPY